MGHVRIMPNKNAHRSSEEATAGTLPHELLTIKELAQKLKISPRKIELDLELPRIRWGRTVRYDFREVMEYLKAI